MSKFTPDALLDAWADEIGNAFVPSLGSDNKVRMDTERCVYRADLLTLIATAHAAGRAEADETIAQRDQSIACLNLAVAIAKQVMREDGDEIARLKLAAAPKHQPNQEKTMQLKAFQVTEDEVWAAASIEEAVADFKETTGEDADPDALRELTDAELDSEVFLADADGEPTEAMTTIRAQLAAMPAAGLLMASSK